MIDDIIEKLEQIEEHIRNHTYDKHPMLLGHDFQTVKNDLMDIKCIIHKSFQKEGESDGRNC